MARLEVLRIVRERVSANALDVPGDLPACSNPNARLDEPGSVYTKATVSTALRGCARPAPATRRS